MVGVSAGSISLRLTSVCGRIVTAAPTHAVALLGVVVVVALLQGTAVVARRCEAQRLEVLRRGLNPTQNTSPVGVGMHSVIVVVEVAARRT